jgi:dUTPase
MPKKSLKPKITYKGEKSVGNQLKANIPATIMGTKINFPHRHLARIDTGVEVNVLDGYVLNFKLLPWLEEKGMVATNAPGRLKSGKVVVNLLNCGREIVELNHGSLIVEVWLEPDIEFDWEEVK